MRSEYTAFRLNKALATTFFMIQLKFKVATAFVVVAISVAHSNGIHVRMFVTLSLQIGIGPSLPIDPSIATAI